MDKKDKQILNLKKERSRAYALYFSARRDLIEKEIELENHLKIRTLLNETSKWEKCVICTEPILDKSVGILKCFHIFHRDCITQWNEHNTTCPFCRVKTEIACILE